MKRSEVLSFLFSQQNWTYHGAVEYRVSHGGIYRRGELTEFSDEELVDTGMTVKLPRLLTPVDLAASDILHHLR